MASVMWHCGVREPIMFYIVNTHQLGRTCHFSKKSMKLQLKTEDFKGSRDRRRNYLSSRETIIIYKFKLTNRRRGDYMEILYELSWLWETLGIALGVAAVCVACTALVCKAAKKKLSKKLLAVIGVVAFVAAILAVILVARTPMPL